MIFQTRQACLEDAQNLAVLATQVFLHTYATSGIRTALSGYVLTEFTPANMRRLLGDPTHLLRVAEAQGHILAFSDLNLQSSHPDVPGLTTELATLYVQEHCSGRGIGSRLLSECSEHAGKAGGNSEFWLSVYFRNEPALAFYRKHGFSKRGSFPFEFGGEQHENHVFARETGL